MTDSKSSISIPSSCLFVLANCSNNKLSHYHHSVWLCEGKMASIRKLKSGNYQVQIRITGLPSLTKTFSKKKSATAFIQQVEGDTELQRKLGKSAAQIPIF